MTDAQRNDGQQNDLQVKQRSKKAVTIAREQIQDIVVLSNDAIFSGTWSMAYQSTYAGYSASQTQAPTSNRPIFAGIGISLLSPLTPGSHQATHIQVNHPHFSSHCGLCLSSATLPTVAVLAFSNGPLAFVAAVPVILGAGSAIGISISRIIWLSNAQVDLFDEVRRILERPYPPHLLWPSFPTDLPLTQVLVQEGLGTLVARGREVRGSSHTGSKIGRLLTKPLDRFSKEAMIRWLISFPLNAIPVVGPAIFFLYNGAKAGPSYHNRYFQLKAMAALPPAPPPPFRDFTVKNPVRVARPTRGCSAQGREGCAPTYDAPMSSRGFNREAWVKAHRGAYAGFGAMAMALDLIPGAAVVCMFGNVVGAALWASRIEKEGTVEGMADLKMEGRKEL
jgi:hypothetical protein